MEIQNGSLTSDFRAKASHADKVARAAIKRATEARNKSNQLAMGNWHNELLRTLNKVTVPRPERAGGYKNA